MAILAGTLYNYAGLKWLPLPGVLRRCGREAGKEFSGVAAARGSQAFWGAAARIGLNKLALNVPQSHFYEFIF